MSVGWEIFDDLKDATMQIFDIGGQVVLTQTINQNTGLETIDTRNFKSGVYLVNFYNQNQLKASKKLVVRK